MRFRLLLAVAPLIVAQVGAVAGTYTNATFGLKMELPPGKVICTAEEYQSDRGVIILWDTRKCPSDRDAAGIYVYVAYNATQRRSTFELGKDNCSVGTARLSPFKVSGFRFYQCLSRTDGGRTALAYFVLRDRKLSSPDNEVTYGVTLICPHDDCRTLMPTTRWIFAHMKFIAQDP